MVEEKLIGTLLAESDCLFDVSGIITPEMFVKHGKLAQWMWDKGSKGIKWSVEICVAEQIVESNVAYKLGAMSDRYRLTEHAIALRRVYLSEKNKSFHAEALKKLDSGVSPDDVDSFIQESKSGLNLPDKINREMAFKDAIGVINGEESPSLMSGIVAFDDMVGGFFKAEMVIIAARPGMGKTGFALSCVRHIVANGARVLFVSLEMGVVQIVHRLAAMDTGISVSDIRNKKLTDWDKKRLTDRINDYKGMGYYFENENKWSILSLKIDEMVRREGIDMVVIDYLQLIQGNQKGNRENEVSDVSRGIKSMCNKLRIPILALSQLNRAVEARGNKRPMLSDLRESGSLEQDADVVAFLYRESYYDKSQGEGTAELDVAKMRNGKIGVGELEFIPHLTLFQ